MLAISRFFHGSLQFLTQSANGSGKCITKGMWSEK